MKTNIRVNVDEQGADYITELTTTEFTIEGKDSVDVGKLEHCSKELLVSIIEYLIATDASEVIEEYKQRMLAHQKEYLRQLNWKKRIEMDWREIETVQQTLNTLRFASNCVSEAEDIQEQIKFKRG